MECVLQNTFLSYRGHLIYSQVEDGTTGDSTARLKFSDIVTVYPTVNEHAAVRSWFPRALCNVLDKPEVTNNYEIRGILDKVAVELADMRGTVRDGLGALHSNVVQTSVYEVTGMAKRFYFPIKTI